VTRLCQFESARRRFLAALAAAGLAYPADRKGKAFPEWSDETVLRLLVDSPWARRKTVPLAWYGPTQRPFTYKDVPGSEAGKIAAPPAPGGAGPLGGIGAPKQHLPDKADLIVRWASALPVRQARALYKLRDEKLDRGRLAELVGPKPDAYILEIFGLPAIMAHAGAEAVEAKFGQTARLRFSGGAMLKPLGAKATVDAVNLSVMIHFSKARPVTAADKEVEFFADVDIVQIRERFRLSAMSYGGTLAL
jgi:hypothetical protein